MAACRCSFAVICIIAVLGEILVVGLQIVSATTKAWVNLQWSKTTFSFGLFALEDDNVGLLRTVKMVKQPQLVTMQAMLVFSIGFGCAAIVTTLLGMTQRQMCGRGTKFFIILSQIFMASSAILYLVGLATFTHSWIKNAAKYFQTTVPKTAVHYYGYAYTIAWLAFLIQLSLAIFVIIYINVVVRREDKRLAEETSLQEHAKLIPKTTSEKAVVESPRESADRPTSMPEIGETAKPKTPEVSE